MVVKTDIEIKEIDVVHQALTLNKFLNCYMYKQDKNKMLCFTNLPSTYGNIHHDCTKQGLLYWYSTFSNNTALGNTQHKI